MIILLRTLLHRIRLLKWAVLPRSTALDFYGEAIKSVAGRWNTELGPVTTYHALFDVLRQNNFSGNLTEIGGGYSTVLAKTLFDSSEVKITSIDAYPQKYYRILNSKNNTRNFLSSINSINSITVSLDDVRKALPEIVGRLMEYEPSALKDALTQFVSDKEVLESICLDVDRKNLSALCNLFLDHDSFKLDIAFYEKFGALTGDWACKDLAKENKVIDCLFLDCGEVSSLAEFLILEKNLKSGSYLLLHDIYFPKSIKNFFLAALLTLDDRWSILYVDTVSTQGGLVARLN